MKDTCKALWAALVEGNMPVPSTEQLKRAISGFFTYCNFPNCVGTIDGKHCRVIVHQTLGRYTKITKTFPFVLQGVADAEYKLVTTEVGGRGIQSDGGTFSTFALYESLESNQINMPPDQELLGTTKKSPNVLFWDEAYPLKTYILNHTLEKNLTLERNMFKYELFRAHRCIECAFGILYSKWRILGKDKETSVEKTVVIIKCACILYIVVWERDGKNDPIYRIILDRIFESDTNFNNNKDVGGTTKQLTELCMFVKLSQITFQHAVS